MNEKKLFCFLFAFIFLFSFYALSTRADSISRSFSQSTIVSGRTLTVSLNVVVDSGATFYAIDETLPDGFLPADAGLGSFNNGHWKYVIIQGAANTTLQYSVVVPQRAGNYSFTGIFAFEGQSEQQILGDSLVSVVNGNLIQVGVKDLNFVSLSASNVSLSSDVKPQFSVYNLSNGTQVPAASLVMNFQPQKLFSSILLQHQIKPFAVPINWNPSLYYYCFDSNMLSTGQYLEFYTNVDENNPEVLNHWNYSDVNEIVFGSTQLLYPVLFFNSLTRDFSRETKAGFFPYKIKINSGLASLCYTTNITSLGNVSLNLYDLITQSKSVCNSGDANVTWFDGNTYFVNVDSNADVENCQLTILGGAVVKYKATVAAGTNLQIKNKGVIKAFGTSDSNRIFFTSENDCSVGADVVGTSNDANCGTALPRDYANALNISSTAGFLPDANDFKFLTVGYARQGILITNGKTYNSFTDMNIHDNNSVTSSGAGISLTIGTRIKDLNNNLFYKNYATTGSGGGLSCAATQININDNNFSNNFVSSGNGAGFSCGAINFFRNQITNNSSYSGNGAGGNLTATTNFFDNNVSNNSIRGLPQKNPPPISSSGAGIMAGITTNFFNNIISNNVLTSITGVGTLGLVYRGGAGIAIVNSTLTNFYNNKIFGNVCTRCSGGGLFVGGTSSTNSIITNAYNNLFVNNDANMGGGIAVTGVIFSGSCTGTFKINNLFNNTFVDNNASVALKGGSILVVNSSPTAGVICASIADNYNNIISYSTNAGIVKSDISSALDSNFNGFWANDTNTSGYTEGTSSVFLGKDPFINDGTDRNFLLNVYGIANLNNKGTSVGNDGFFSDKTTRYDDKVDSGTRDMGYHYDLNIRYSFDFYNFCIYKSGSFSACTDLNAVADFNIVYDFNIAQHQSALNTSSVNVYYESLDSHNTDKNCWYWLGDLHGCNVNEHSTFSFDNNGSDYHFRSNDEDDHAWKKSIYLGVNSLDAFQNNSKPFGFQITASNRILEVLLAHVRNDTNTNFSLSFDANYFQTNVLLRNMQVYDCNQQIGTGHATNPNCNQAIISPTTIKDTDNYYGLHFTSANDANCITINKRVCYKGDSNSDTNHWLYFECSNCNANNFWTLPAINQNPNSIRTFVQTSTNNGSSYSPFNFAINTHMHFIDLNAGAAAYWFVEAKNALGSDFNSSIQARTILASNEPPSIVEILQPQARYYSTSVPYYFKVHDDNFAQLQGLRCDVNFLYDSNMDNAFVVVSNQNPDTNFVCEGNVSTTGMPDANYVARFRVKETAGLDKFDANLNLPFSFEIDTNAPTTTLTESSGIVTLSCMDFNSGCFLTQYRINSGAWQNYVGAFSLLAGTSVIDYNSTDNAGNTETTKTRTIFLTGGTGSPAGGGGGIVSGGIIKTLDVNLFVQNNSLVIQIKTKADSNFVDTNYLLAYLNFSGTRTKLFFYIENFTRIQKGFYEVKVPISSLTDVNSLYVEAFVFDEVLSKLIPLTLNELPRIEFSPVSPSFPFLDWIFSFFQNPSFEWIAGQFVWLNFPLVSGIGFLYWHAVIIIIVFLIVLFFILKRRNSNG